MEGAECNSNFKNNVIDMNAWLPKWHLWEINLPAHLKYLKTVMYCYRSPVGPGTASNHLSSKSRAKLCIEHHPLLVSTNLPETHASIPIRVLNICHPIFLPSFSLPIILTWTPLIFNICEELNSWQNIRHTVFYLRAGR